MCERKKTKERKNKQSIKSITITLVRRCRLWKAFFVLCMQKTYKARKRCTAKHIAVNSSRMFAAHTSFRACIGIVISIFVAVSRLFPQIYYTVTEFSSLELDLCFWYASDEPLFVCWIYEQILIAWNYGITTSNFWVLYRYCYCTRNTVQLYLPYFPNRFQLPTIITLRSLCFEVNQFTRSFMVQPIKSNKGEIGMRRKVATCC